MMRSFFSTFASTVQKSSARCLQVRWDYLCTLFQINLLMYAIFLIAILYKSYILFSSNVSCISIIYLHRLIILIVWLSVINRYIKIHLLLNLDYFTHLIIKNGER